MNIWSSFTHPLIVEVEVAAAGREVRGLADGYPRVSLSLEIVVESGGRRRYVTLVRPGDLLVSPV